MKSNPNSPFRFVKNIQENLSLTQDEMKEFSVFLMSKLYYYAGYEKYVNIINLFWSLPKEYHYILFCLLFKGKKPYGWIKNTKVTDKNDKIIEYIKNMYQISRKEATEYIDLLSNDDLKQIKKEI